MKLKKKNVRFLEKKEKTFVGLQEWESSWSKVWKIWFV